ncbi:polysaccharide deacetylase family protein [Brevundimonas fluminis]|jgi:peptidoglycan/xylan/chitin deacetylase (PgdA/CDA1 family)|uniref:polysaccharide deacetylase family protein n=1 Tax=Brevundimonas fluminis TaxID=2487274 RepID=UPI000F657AAE|nr:polysaccharide deacetylase family protein [Brevundimonas fluminis]
MQAFVDKMRRRAGRWLDRRPVRVRAPGGMLSLSFDDFPETAWTEAGPVLAQHGVKATYYVCGGLERGENLGLPQFTADHMRELFFAGHEVGCHTYEHVSTLTLSPAELGRSLARNALWVADRLDGHVMETFAYPFGDVALGAKSIIDLRFALGRGVRNGVNAGTEDRNALKAIGLESRRLPGYDLDALCAEAAARDGWLIAYGHDVSDAPTPYGCTARDLERLVLAAKSAGLTIVPVAEGWRRLAA